MTAREALKEAATIEEYEAALNLAKMVEGLSSEARSLSWVRVRVRDPCLTYA